MQRAPTPPRIISPAVRRAPTPQLLSPLRNEASAIQSINEDVRALMDPEPEIELLPTIRKEVRRFHTEGNDYRVRIKVPERIPMDTNVYFRKFFQKIADAVIKDIPDNDTVGMTFSWSALDRPAYYPFGLKKDFDVKKFLERLEKILQSDKELSPRLYERVCYPCRDASRSGEE